MYSAVNPDMVLKVFDAKRSSRLPILRWRNSELACTCKDLDKIECKQGEVRDKKY